MSKACSLVNGKIINLAWWVNFLEIETWDIKKLTEIDNPEEITKICNTFIQDFDFGQFSKNLAAKLSIQPFRLIELDNTLTNDSVYKKRLYFLSETGRVFLDTALEYWKQSDYENARAMFTKVGYSIKTIETESSFRDQSKILKQKNKILEIQMEFASYDPLYKSTLKKLLSIIVNRPGLLQKDIYSAIDQSKEEIMYVLYFADKLNDIKRNKKGSSYELYPTSFYLQTFNVNDADKLDKINPYIDS